ncbi:MAG: hypothetical protein KQJ78_08700 [Deltaproteobacteria bacterium]|nr:hypothetical protein [Deltaproteobacteria bacterium]
MPKKTETPVSFDLAALETGDNAQLEIMDLRGEPTGLKITLAGPHSTQVKEALRRGEQKIVRFQRRIGNPRRMNKAQEEEYNELLREIVFERLIDTTLAWESSDSPDKIMFGGEELACTPENVRRVYEKVPFLKEQVQSLVADEANFIRSSEIN